jgi:urea-proton symporter
MMYSLLFQVFTSDNLLVGRSTLYVRVMGMSQDAACFFFALGVIIYTLFGGIKAMFLTD